MEIFNHNANVNFLGMRKISVGIAILLMIASIALIAVKGLNYGLDFTGGVSLVVDYDNPVQVGEVRDALEKGGMEHALVQSLGGTKEVSIRLQPKDDPNSGLNDGGKVNLDKIADDVTRTLQVARPDAKLKSRDYVGSAVGEELRSDGIVAAIVVV